MKKNRVYIVYDKGRVWEAYSDQPTKLIIKNVDRGYIREQFVQVNPRAIDDDEQLLKDLDEAKIKLPGIEDEEKEILKVKKLKNEKSKC